jgi:hypothetical protein
LSDSRRGLQQAFIPEAQINILRSYAWQRDRWLADAGRAMQHMQQTLNAPEERRTGLIQASNRAISIPSWVMAGSIELMSRSSKSILSPSSLILRSSGCRSTSIRLCSSSIGVRLTSNRPVES